MTHNVKRPPDQIQMIIKLSLKSTAAAAAFKTALIKYDSLYNKQQNGEKCSPGTHSDALYLLIDFSIGADCKIQHGLAALTHLSGVFLM